MKLHGVNIVGRGNDKSGISAHTKAFLYCLAPKYAVNFINTRPEIGYEKFEINNVLEIDDTSCNIEDTKSGVEADVSIFVDVTSNHKNDFNWKKTPITRLKFLYSVFDSTQIPSSWTEIINNHFDAVFVPSRFLVEVYRSSNVKKPIFYLPLALELNNFLNLSNKSVKCPFTFTFIGSNEKRKNVDLLLRVFANTFGVNSDVALYVHCALDFIGNFQEFYYKYKKFTNIIFSHESVSDSKYLDIVDRSDCFISLSKGEGFSIVPRQFLAAGKPVILSNCFAHTEILNELSRMSDGLAFSIETPIPVAARYDHINGGEYIGIQYNVYEKSVSDCLINVFSQKSSLFDENKVYLRKKFASQFSIEAMSNVYQSIVSPSFCRMTSGNELELGGISTSDGNLISRIAGRNCSVSPWQNFSISTQKIVVIGNDGGFFSVFNRFVSYLTWTLSENPDSVVLPDWRVEAMQKHWKITNFTSFCYGKPEDGNIWLKLFKPLPYANFSLDQYNSESDLYDNAQVKDDYNEFNEPWLTYVHAYKLYKSPGFNRWRHWYNLYFSTYIDLNDDIKIKIQNLYDKFLKGYQVISAHIRHPSHGIEQPGHRMPTVELYIEIIRKILIENDFTVSNSRIFLATDQSSVVKQLKNEFGDMLVYLSDVLRTTEEDDTAFGAMSEIDKQKEGFQIQHLTASDFSKWSYKMAQDVIVDTYLLAKGHHFVHVTSNIATAVSYINPRITMHYCE